MGPGSSSFPPLAARGGDTYMQTPSTEQNPFLYSYLTGICQEGAFIFLVTTNVGAFETLSAPFCTRLLVFSFIFIPSPPKICTADIPTHKRMFVITDVHTHSY